MNINPETLRQLLADGEIDRASWAGHFLCVPEGRVPSCEDCLDLKNGSCHGDDDPVECFLYGSHARSDGHLLTSPGKDSDRGSGTA